jgi:putative transposase
MTRLSPRSVHCGRGFTPRLLQDSSTSGRAFGPALLAAVLWEGLYAPILTAYSGSMLPERGYSALRFGRWSTAFAEYLVSFCTLDRRSGLDRPEITAAIIAHWRGLEKAGAWEIRTGSVMPDHAHVLFRLGAGCDLAAAMRLCKGPLTPLLRSAGLHWQEGYHDRRLRPNDEILPVFLYIFLNPYRAGLLNTGAIWPGYFCCAEDWAWFSQLTQANCPFPEWLQD